MQSKVSFKFDGEHNKPFIKPILDKKLTGVKLHFEKIDRYTFRVYVYANEEDEIISNVCRGIQSNCLIDHTYKF
jgi:hypothetical protein